MPKVNFVKCSRKDWGGGINIGDSFYWWKIRLQRGGIVRRSKEYPRPSQLTASEYKSPAYLINENLEDAIKAASCLEDLEEARDDAVSAAEELRDEQQEKLDNMPEGLQSSDTGQLIEERIAALESFISDLESWEKDQYEEEDEDEEAKKEKLEEAREELASFGIEVS